MRRLALAAGSYYRYVILRKQIGNTCVQTDQLTAKKNENNNEGDGFLTFGLYKIIRLAAFALTSSIEIKSPHQVRRVSDVDVVKTYRETFVKSFVNLNKSIN